MFPFLSNDVELLRHQILVSAWFVVSEHRHNMSEHQLSGWPSKKHVPVEHQTMQNGDLALATVWHKSEQSTRRADTIRAARGGARVCNEAGVNTIIPYQRAVWRLIDADRRTSKISPSAFGGPPERLFNSRAYTTISSRFTRKVKPSLVSFDSSK